jgi:zinc/manganese transport system permease protein
LAGSVLIEPGFFESPVVRSALLTGGVVAVVSAMVGVFTVIRGQSFAGHALGDMGTLGGSGAFLTGVSPLWGYIGAGIVVSGTMELFGVQRRRGRDVATGIVLGAALGLSALLLYFDTTRSSTTGATVTILFGSLFSLSGSTVPAMVALGSVGAVVLLALYRPLLLSSLSPDLAAARGVPVRTVSLAFLLLLGVAVSLTAIVVGTILSTALLVGPAAASLRLTRRPGAAMAVAALIGVVVTWLGILLAYDSYDWPPSHHGWPVSFLVVALVFVVYLVTELTSREWGGRGRAASEAGG